MLLPRAGGAGRVPAHEILIGAPRVRQLVAAGVTDFGLAMEAGRGVGMQTFDDALLSLYERGIISQQMAASRMSDRGRMPAPAPDEANAA
jgi:twitching motility protein PilT